MQGISRTFSENSEDAVSSSRPSPNYEEPAAPEIVAEQSWRAPEAEADEDDLLEPESEVADSSARLLEHFSQEIQGAVDDLSQEVRRVGRELFKTNRAADRNGELFEQSLREMQRLTEAIARIPDKFDEKSSEAVFQAKASLCQDLFRVVDAMEASLSSAEDVLARIRKNAEHSPSGFSLMMMRSARELRQMLMDSVEAMSRWIEGQSLLVERVKGALQAAGARVIECEGQMFNPALHRAIAVERRSGAQAGTILKCELKGYTLDGKILRYAEVVVAKDEQGSRN